MFQAVPCQSSTCGRCKGKIRGPALNKLLRRALLVVLQVLWYVPNCIGYLRCALLAAALQLGPAGAGRCYACLCANLALDALDGWAARALDQVHSPRMH